MKIAWIQYDIHWENPERNLSFLNSILDNHSSNFDLLVLPEMFDTGFAMNPSALSDRDQNNTIEWMKKTAIKYDTAVMGSLIFQQGDHYYNRIIFTNGDEIAEYDKNHLFKLSGEHHQYEEGDAVLDMHWKEFKIRPLICYDLRFPEIARNTEDLGLLIYVASWPKARIDHWSTLLKARAIENQCYTLGVNRLGIDGNTFEYNGMSTLFAYDGKEILCSQSESGIYQAEIELEAMKAFRKKLPFLQDCKLIDEL